MLKSYGFFIIKPVFKISNLQKKNQSIPDYYSNNAGKQDN